MERTRTVARSRPFIERHRRALTGLAVVAAIVLVGGFIFVQATAKAYACTTQTDPAPAATSQPNGSPAPLGQVQPDMGRDHIADGASARYTYCPPASGGHYNGAAVGPIEARYYAPDDATVPQGWIHNLEHGGMVILYSCDQGACDDATQQALKSLFQTFPDSPVCAVPKGNTGPVITRFEQMKAPIAALLWGRELFQTKLDTAQILEYFKTQAEQHNPEPECQRPAPSAAPAPSGSAVPVPSGSAAPAPSSSGDPAPSSSATPMPSAVPSPSPS